MDAPPRLVVMASGAGSNLQAVIDATRTGRLPAVVAAVVSNIATSGALARAEHAALPAITVERRPGEARGDYDARLADAVYDIKPDWVVLAGWMRLLTSTFLDRFPNRVINLHPALPGDLPGLDAIERAFDESRHGHRTQSGVMVHLVPDEGVDDGPLLASVVVQIRPDDTLDTFARRMHDAEHEILVSTLARLCTSPDTRPQITGVTT
jgi:phosphoribosylglycinamide formyltransferase 1